MTGPLVVALALSMAQQPPIDSLVHATLEAHRRPFDVASGALTGPGGEWLLERAGAARFTLIGESHLNAETPAFTAALLRGLRPRGYSTYVTETGPESTRLLVETLRRGGFDAGEAWMADLPFSIAFLDQREELRTVVDALEMGYDIWGVDQEFIGSPRLLLRRLVAIAPNEGARAVAQAMLDRAVEGFQHFLADGDQSAAFMVTATGEDLDALAGAFAGAGDEADRILAQLRASHGVYHAYFEGRYYDNNATRVDLIRRNLLAHMERAGESPLSDRRALIKAGSIHAGRGRTPMRVFDIGALAAELAFTNGLESFHVNVLTTGSVDAAGAPRSWREQSPELVPLMDLTPETGPVVFDLRPLRALLSDRGGKSEALEELQDIALRFDAMVMYPRFHRADAITPMPGG